MASLSDWVREYWYIVKGKVSMLRYTDPKRYYRRGAGAKISVLLIPGISSNWGFLKSLGDYLHGQGYAVYACPELKNNWADIPTAARIVRSMIEREGLKNVVIIGHSKGGLIGKYVLAHENAKGVVKGLVAIAAPFHGTSYAKYMPGKPYKELLPGSKNIAELEFHTAVDGQIITITPAWDNMVRPEEGTALAGAKENITVPTRGHNVLAFDPRAWEAVRNAVRKLAS
jgi:triacylglycerol lipase